MTPASYSAACDRLGVVQMTDAEIAREFGEATTEVKFTPTWDKASETVRRCWRRVAEKLLTEGVEGI